MYENFMLGLSMFFVVVALYIGFTAPMLSGASIIVPVLLFTGLLTLWKGLGL